MDGVVNNCELQKSSVTSIALLNYYEMKMLALKEPFRNSCLFFSFLYGINHGYSVTSSKFP